MHVDIPLQAYFRINTPNMGQFERTLIIADEGSYVHYVEGCTAPIYSTDSLHSGVVEIFVEPHARVRYTTVQNWSNNVYNLVTQRAYVREGGTMEWVDGNIGSKATMKYPACILAEPYAKASTMSLGFAGKGQYQDTGAKMIHLAPHTSSTIVAKSISRGGGRSAYRGLVKIVILLDLVFIHSRAISHILAHLHVSGGVWCCVFGHHPAFLVSHLIL